MSRSSVVAQLRGAMKFAHLAPRALLLSLALAPSAARAANVTVFADFSARTGRVADARQYGLNLFHVYDPTVSQDNATYRANLAAMHPAYVRVHSWEMLQDSTKSNGWITGGNAWDATKIGRALTNALPWKPTIMINVPWGPSGVTGDAIPTAAQEDAFAAFCASLVKIVNVDKKLGVTHFEIPNERDGLYKDRGADLGRLFVKAARAMKKVDPTIKVGGPAFTQPWIDTVDPFLAVAKDDVDFISYHTYSTGDGNADLQKLFDNAAGLGGIATMFKDKLAKLTTRKIELYHDEYNISWAPPDARMNDERGAVFDALALIGFGQSDVTGAAAWNEADGWYGKLDSAYQMRPAAHVFALFSSQLVGPVVTTASSSPGLVVPFAVASSAGPSLVLVNRSGDAQTAKIMSTGLSQPKLAQITRAGRSDRSPTATELDALMLPPYSVSVLMGAGGSVSTPQAGVAGGPDTGAAGATAGSVGSAGASAGSGGDASGAAGQGGGAGAAGSTASKGGSAGRGGQGGSSNGGSGDDSTGEPAPRSSTVSGGCSVGGTSAGGAGILWLAFALVARRSRRRR